MSVGFKGYLHYISFSLNNPVKVLWVHMSLTWKWINKRINTALSLDEYWIGANGGSVSVIQKGKKCQRTVRPQEPVRITFAGCSTAQLHRPRTCGTCTDGRCCTPSLSRTVRLRFDCPDGEGFSRNVMWIQRCNCSTRCRTHDGPSIPSVSLHNDIHTFRHWGWVTGRSSAPPRPSLPPPLCEFLPPPPSPGNTPACTLSFQPQWHQFVHTCLVPGQHWGQHTVVCCCAGLLAESSYSNSLFIWFIITLCPLHRGRLFRPETDI